MAVPSGTYGFNPGLSDLTLEAFSRIQIYPTALTPHHMYQARMSANLVLADFANDQPNLWTQDLQSVPLVTGTATYAVPSNTITVLDAYVRQFEVGEPTNLTNPFSTTLASSIVNVNYPLHGLFTNAVVVFVTPASIGGIIILGFYTVTAVVDNNNFQITSSQIASGTVSGGGSLPIITTTTGSQFATIVLANHGLSQGMVFNIQVPTEVGGVLLQGVYNVVAVNSPSQFTIDMQVNAGSNQSVTENNGQTLVEVQLPNVDPIDRPIIPISRTDYADFPDKVAIGFPSVYFFLRTENPTITLWQVPDGNGPYVLYYWRVRQMQDAVMANGTTMDMPYRFLEAFTASLAAKLARKYAPQLVADLRMEAAEAYIRAKAQDTETLVSLHIMPGLQGYYR